MQNLGEALAEVITNLMPSPSDGEHACEHCGNTVPKYPLQLTSSKGIVKTIMVQPRCKCEVQAWEQDYNEPIERKEKNEIERKFSISNLGERFAESKFESFTPRAGSEKAYQLAEQYAKTFPDYGSEALLIWGDPGNGKSHLAAAACHTIKAEGYTVVFQSVPELLERIRSTFRGKQNSESEKEIMDALLMCKLLVLDDIGAEKVSDWVQDVLFRIIDGRYRRKVPTFYTSNLRPSELNDRLGNRIYDRVMETSIIVENKATSYRLETAKARMKAMEK